MSTEQEERLRLRNEPITQEVFDRLPALLSAFQTKLVTGWNDQELTDAVRERRVEVWVRTARKGHKRGYRKYLKVSVAKIVGYKI